MKHLLPLGIALALGGVTAPAGAIPAPDSTATLQGEGAVLGDMTVEGENRIQIEFERPELNLDLDPKSAPGLDWSNSLAVLERDALDLVTPMVAASAADRTPFLGRPWFAAMQEGPVARFQPEVEGVDRWTLLVADSRGATVARFQGTSKVPKEIPWDGSVLDGGSAVPGLTYSYQFEAYDKAGNKRVLNGEGFQVPPYRRNGNGTLTMTFAGSAVFATPAARDRGISPSILLETASWLNQVDAPRTPVLVEATARTFDEAKAISDVVSGTLSPLLLGDPARIQARTTVAPDAPAGGTVTVTLGP